MHSFAHDRYIHAAEKLTEYLDAQKMHFVISRTMMKYSGSSERSLFVGSLHVCEAAPLIQKRVKHRAEYRKLLVEAAQAALESGARATALKYLETALQLLQLNPWNGDLKDVDYRETLDLHVQAAQLHWHQGEDAEAQSVLGAVFSNVSSARDKATPWVLQSRISMRKGHTEAAFHALRTSLSELGLDIDANASWESCDKDYHVLRAKIQSMDHSSLPEQRREPSNNDDPTGVVLVEAISAAFWTDKLTFYQMVLKVAEMYIRNFSATSHIGLGLAYFALVSTAYSYTTRLRFPYRTILTIGSRFQSYDLVIYNSRIRCTSSREHLPATPTTPLPAAGPSPSLEALLNTCERPCVST